MVIGEMGGERAPAAGEAGAGADEEGCCEEPDWRAGRNGSCRRRLDICSSPQHTTACNPCGELTGGQGMCRRQEQRSNHRQAHRTQKHESGDVRWTRTANTEYYTHHSHSSTEKHKHSVSLDLFGVWTCLRREREENEERKRR